MTGLLACLISIQLTFGPMCLLEEQEIVSDDSLTGLVLFAYLPLGIVSTVVPALGETFESIGEEYRQILPSARQKLVINLTIDEFTLVDVLPSTPQNGVVFVIEGETIECEWADPVIWPFGR